LSMKHYDCIIIGAGAAGLMAAITAAKKYTGFNCTGTLCSKNVKTASIS